MSTPFPAWRAGSVAPFLVTCILTSGVARGQSEVDGHAAPAGPNEGASRVAATAGTAKASTPPEVEQQSANRAPPTGDDEAWTEPSPLERHARRPVPDYDGRGPEPRRAGQGALWVPRILLGPLYLTSEYLVRRPLGYVATNAERHHWPSMIVDFFTFGPRRRSALIPTALVDFGFRSSAGALFLWNDAGWEGNDLRLRGAWGGKDWATVSLADFVKVAPRQELKLRVAYTRRPDWVFHGLGPEAESDRTRFLERRTIGGLDHHARWWRSSEVVTTVDVRDSSFDPDHACCKDSSVAAAVEAGRYPMPEGMDGYTALRSGVAAVWDTRRPRKLSTPRPGSDFVSPSGSGVRVAGRALHGAGLRDAPASVGEEATRYEWISYGATVGGFADLTGRQRVLGLELVADFADPVGGARAVPFTELVSLGGRRPMRGFLEGRLRDRSAVVARLEYQYPVWVWLDGALTYEIGNVFGAGLEGVEPGRLRQSMGLALRANNAREHAFELYVGAGTRTFDQGGGIDAVRIVLGATSGY